MPESITDFSARIKAKYPDYSNVPDEELVNRIVAKHPEYASQVDMVTKPADQPQSGLSQAYDFAKGTVENVASGLNPANIYQAFRHPIEPMLAELQKAKEAHDQGNTMEAMARIATGVFPVIGPMIGNMAEQPAKLMYGETPEARGQAFGTMISPKVGAMALGGIGSAVEKAAPAIYRSALGRGLETVTENPKTGESKVPGVSAEQLQNRVVSQGIDKGLIASRAGAKGSRLNTKAYKAEIDRRISDIETQQLGPGNVVSRDAVANYVDPTQMPDLNTVNRAQDTATAMAVKDKFVADRTPQMPASESQAVKVATDKSLGERAFQGISGPAEKGELRLRTGLMNELESLDPGLEGVNQNTQTSIFLTRAILKAAKSTNTWKQATSTPNLITSGLGYATLGYKGAIILPILRQIIDRPDVKSALAIAIDRMAKFKADQGISSQPLNPALYGQGEQDRQP